MQIFLVTGKHTWSVKNNPAKSGFRARILAESEQQIRDAFPFAGVTDVVINPLDEASIPYIMFCSHPF